MKAKLNLTIEENLLEKAKVYALKKRKSLSGIVEDYLQSIVQPPVRRRNILDIVDKLKPDPDIIAESNRKSSFYETQREKHGF